MPKAWITSKQGCAEQIVLSVGRKVRVSLQSVIFPLQRMAKSIRPEAILWRNTGDMKQLQNDTVMNVMIQIKKSTGSYIVQKSKAFKYDIELLYVRGEKNEW